MPIRVLLVDDSAVVRGLLNNALSTDPDIEIIGTAGNGQLAVKFAGDLKPDIVILDIEMPIMDGITALPEIIKASPSTKVIMSSSLTLRNASISLKALSLGATDYLAKPTADGNNNAEVFHRELKAKIKAICSHKLSGNAGSNSNMSVANNSVLQKPISTTSTTVTPSAQQALTAKPITANPSTSATIVKPLNINIQTNLIGVKALAIASSTGGPQALMTLFESLKGQLLHIPIFITQHMPPTFTTILADQITTISGRKCYEVNNGDIVSAGNIYLARGDYHMVPEQNPEGKIVIKTNQAPQENFCRPAADPMLRALSKIYGKQLLVAVLTGMGQDGMLGSKVVVENGGSVIAQDEASCVVYGMPKAVADAKICRAILPLQEIGKYLISQIGMR